MNKADITVKLKKKIKQAKQTRDELLKKQDLVNEILSREKKLDDEMKISQIKRKISKLN